MSTRDEILAALRKHPAGLSSAELAPLCPGADYDQFIVARVIAQLRQEGALAGAASGPRNGHTVFVLAREAATIQQHKQAPPAPVTETPPPATKGNPMSITQQILAALENHGPMDTQALAKYVRSANLAVMASTLARDGKLAVDKRGGRRHYIYSLPGAAPAAPRASSSRPAQQRPAPGAKVSGNGAADFAITARGEISIRKGEHVVSLEPAEYAALRQFTERAEAIWKETI